MKLRKWFAREILALLVMAMVASFLGSVQESYTQISYAELISLFKENKVSEIAYNESGKSARILDSTTETYYQVGIISNEKFEEDVYNYSLTNDAMKFYSYIPSPRISFGLTIAILLFINILFREFWNKVDEHFAIKHMSPEEKKEYKRS